jgi:hypothetical protein
MYLSLESGLGVAPIHGAIWHAELFLPKRDMTRGVLGVWRRGMELNHQIRLCRPFPFLFGFRAIRNVNVKCLLIYFIKTRWESHNSGRFPTAADEGAYVGVCDLYLHQK